MMLKDNFQNRRITNTDTDRHKINVPKFVFDSLARELETDVITSSKENSQQTYEVFRNAEIKLLNRSKIGFFS